MKGVRVRPMREEDVERAAAITRAITRRAVSPAWRHMVRSFIRASGESCLVAEEKGRVLGFILGEMKESGFGAARSGWIEVLGVDPRHMGRGVGKLLGGKLLSLFRDKGATAVFTAVRWDSGDLLEFFRAIGFDRSDFIILERGFSGKTG